MNKTWVSRAAAVWLAVAGPIFMASAPLAQATPSDGDYVRMSVPDMRQAVGFFRDVMNCEVIDAEAGPAAAVPTGRVESALMNCAHGMIVELTTAPVAPRRNSATSNVVFVTNDTVAATAWLHSKHVTVLGAPTEVRSGANSRMLAVNFLSPWGQPLQLIGPAPEVPTANARLAVQ